ncbi:TRAP transporter small permease [Mammaliicoccus sciuri]|uniref:TRAP transporter small permease n=1 Tax=Mammaliicoccus sciuri TaxID=1296 RepID=UPI002DB80A9E|nr:TRAP transporter small permease [Mammaliicoccus sciuri]MEB7424557.1 TRAP transporter small permease [Mammaliicoccus sciuri]
MNKLTHYIDRTLLTVSGVLITVMVILSVWQVITRYILNTPSTTSEEIIRFLLIWFALLSAAYVFGKKKHIAILFIRERFPLKAQLFIERLTNIIILLVALILMIYGGIKIVALTWTQIAPSTGVSMALMYGALPISGLFIAFYSIRGIITNELPENDEGGEV